MPQLAACGRLGHVGHKLARDTKAATAALNQPGEGTRWSCRVLFASGSHAPRLCQITQRKLVTTAAGSLDKVKVIAGGDAASLPPSRDRRVRHPKVGSEQGKRWPYADDLFHAADYAFCMARSQCPMHSDQ